MQKHRSYNLLHIIFPPILRQFSRPILIKFNKSFDFDKIKLQIQN